MKANKIYLVVAQYTGFDTGYKVVSTPQFTKNSANIEALKFALSEKEALKEGGYTFVVIQHENGYIKVIADGTLATIYHIVALPIV